MADAAEWSVRQEKKGTLIHYLDDFLILAPPLSTCCEEALSILLEIFERLGLSVAGDKLEGPSTVITFLGIELDSNNMVCRLPEKKLRELQVLVAQWLGRKSCTRKELQSLVGKLQHACKVVRPGRTFLRRLFELLRVAGKPHHHIHLTAAFRSDLYW